MRTYPVCIIPCTADVLSAKDLCERCEEDKATISCAVEDLETNEYLTWGSKTAKRYKSRIVLTDKGNEIGKKN